MRKNLVVDIYRNRHYATDISEHYILNSLTAHKNQEYAFESINEGLIVSYDIDKCRAYLKKLFPQILSIISNVDNPYNPRQSRVCRGSFASIFINNGFNSYRDIINKIEPLIGWFVPVIVIKFKGNGRSYYFQKFKTDRYDASKYDYIFEGEINGKFVDLDDIVSDNIIQSMELIVEAKYAKRYYQKNGEVFYHITQDSNRRKIDKVGILPKTSGNYPERIYLTKCIEDAMEMILGKIADRGAVYNVDVNGLELYIDPRNDLSYFTYDNISPKMLRYIGAAK